MAYRVFCITCILCWLCAFVSAEELTPAFTTDDLDLPRCEAFDGVVSKGSPPIATLETLCGLREGQARWEIGPPAGKDRYFRLAFTKPLHIGTIFTEFARADARNANFQRSLGAEISYLKTTAVYPGDVTRDEEWVALPAGALKTLPPGIVTRALRFSDRYQTPQSFASRLGKTLIFQQRYYDAATLGYVQETGKAFTKQVWLGAWERPQAVAGMITRTICTGYLHMEALKPDAPEVANHAPDARWKRLKDHTITTMDYSIYRVEAPLASRGFRAFVEQNNAYVFVSMLALVNLGDIATPPTLDALPPPPFTLPYTMPMDGFIALQISNKATGARVRRLIAEVSRDKGLVKEPWDLKDDAGQYVPPGDYTWTALARPPLKLTYELTAYNAGQPAWPAPVNGGGDWLGDHGAPSATCAVGDQVFVGCSVAEGGNSIIAVDRDGNKLWGEGALQLGFSGPDRIAGDARYAYFIREAFVQEIDAQEHYATRTLTITPATRDLPYAPVTGAAKYKDKLYIAYNPPPTSWLQPPFAAEQMDPKKSQPMVWLRKGNGQRGGRDDKNYGEGEYDELMQFYAAFLTAAMPATSPSQPGVALASSTQAFFGDAPEGGALLVAYHTPIPVGSVMVPDARIQVSVLKPGAKLPEPNPEQDTKDPEIVGGGDTTASGEGMNEDDWQPLPMTGTPGHPGVALAPAGGLRTQALRFKTTRLSFALVLGRRFADLGVRAERILGEGKNTASGGWTVQRDPSTPITPVNPARMALVWKEAVAMRGVSIIRPTALSTTAVDYWVGPAGVNPADALADDTQWRNAGQFQPIVFGGYNAQAPTVRNVDFGKIVTTRAVRVRVLEPEGYRKPPYGLQPITDVNLAGFGGIVVYQHLGDDPALPVTYDQRITEYQTPAPTEKDPHLTILRQLLLPAPGNMAFDTHGTLYCATDGQIVTLPLDGNAPPKVVVTRDKFATLGDLTIAADGLLYVTDVGKKHILVCDPKTGQVVRTIGKPGGQRVGPWDPERLDNPTGVTVDSAGKLWVTDQSWQPKRVQRWNRDGTVEKWFLGPTSYGGGGWLDPGDRSVVNYNGMKFVIDWATHEWRLDSILYRPGAAESSGGAMPDRPVYYHGRRYLVGPDITAGVATICEERNQIAVPMAATGPLDAWADVDFRPDLHAKFGALMRERYTFLWWDANGDAIPQAAEVQLTDKRLGVAFVGEDLSFNYIGARLIPQLQPNGIPAFDLGKLTPAPFTRTGWVTADGRMFSLSKLNTLFAPDGKTALWTYPNAFNSSGGFYASGFGGSRPAGVLNEEHFPIGHFSLGNEEYFVTNSDAGDWFCYTGDGLLAGCILGGPAGYGLRQWTMPEWERGITDLTDLRPGQEHYHGCVVKANDGKLYAVAGHHHVSLVRVDGLEEARRLNGACTVTGADILQEQQWEVLRALRERVHLEPKVANMPFINTNLAIDGSLDDWPEALFFTIQDHWVRGLIRSDYIIDAQAAVAFDAEKLYIAAWALDDGPFKNSAKDPSLLFKFGNAVDVTLGLDTKADPKRMSAGPGDIRLLLSMIKDEPVAMLYRPVAPGAPPEKHARFQSPVGETLMDLVEKIPDADVAVQGVASPTTYKWTLEAAIPWKALGYPAPRIGTHLRGDVGILQRDKSGLVTVGRLYWAGKTQTVICDIPSEARLSPSLWGEFILSETEGGTKFGPEDGGLE